MILILIQNPLHAPCLQAFPGVGVPHAQMNGAAVNGLARTSMGIPAQHAAGAMTNGLAERAQVRGS